MLKRAYYYVFYKLYKMSEAAPSKWLSDWKASLAIDVLLFFFLFSVTIYYKIFVNRYFSLDNKFGVGIIYVLFIVIPNYFIFHHKDQWKDIVAEFDQLPKKKNLIGSWIVFGVVLLVIANLIFSFYLMSQIDWSQYR